MNFRQKVIIALIGVSLAAQATARKVAESVEKSARKTKESL